VTDLTLNEYEGLSEKELERILTEEAREICGSDSSENNLGKRFKLFFNSLLMLKGLSTGTMELNSARTKIRKFFQ
jgi:hypothetical protein